MSAEQDVLLVIDVQNDFCPGGALAVPDGDAILPVVNGLARYEMATRRMLFGRFAVHLTGSHLTAEAWGEPVEVARHQPAVEVKGATYTELRVRREADGCWTARCVVDV